MALARGGRVAMHAPAFGAGGGGMTKRMVRVIGGLGALWNLMGVASYLAQVGLFGGEAAVPPGAAPMPAAITAAFAIAVFGGLAGSIGLALSRGWAAPVLWLSLAASVIDWAWVLRYGAGEVWLGVAVVVIALGLAVTARAARPVVARG